MRVSRGDVAREILRGGHAHHGLIARRAGELRNERFEFGLGARVFTLGQQILGALDHGFGSGRGVIGAHGIAQREKRGGGAGGLVGIRVIEIDALIILGGAGQVARGFVGHGEGKIAIGLGQIGVAIAQHAHGVGGGAGDSQRAGFEHDGFGGKWRP